jgi:hypothetical protein
MRRVRGTGGRFLSLKERQELEQGSPSTSVEEISSAGINNILCSVDSLLCVFFVAFNNAHLRHVLV